jgi:hypothetical protein
MTPEIDSVTTRHGQEPPTNAELLRAARRRTREEILKRTAQTATDPRFRALAPILFVVPFVAPQFLGPDTVPESRYLAR